MAQKPLEFLIEIAKDLSQAPLFIFPKEKQKAYIEKPSQLVGSLKANLETTKGEIYSIFGALEKTLAERQINEVLIANALSHLAQMFGGNDTLEAKKLAKELYEYSQTFSNRANIRSTFMQMISSHEQEKTPEEIRELDKNTLQTGGIFYCMEFYLAIYLEMKGKNDSGKKYYLVEEKINLGTGQSTGFLDDLHNDEALTKFIYLMINDEWREFLTRDYYALKLATNKIIPTQDKQGKKTYEYQVSLDEIMKNFKAFLITLTNILQQAGFKSITSVWYKPLGENPSLEMVLQSLQE